MQATCHAQRSPPSENNVTAHPAIAGKAGSYNTPAQGPRHRWFGSASPIIARHEHSLETQHHGRGHHGTRRSLFAG